MKTPTLTPNPVDSPSVAQLTAEHGSTGVAPFLGNPGVTTVELCGGRAVGGYAKVGRWAVTPGDIVAPPELRDVALSQYLDLLSKRRLRPAFLAVADPEPFRARGMHLTEIADEAVIDLPSFTLAGSRRANLRHSTSSASRAGLQMQPYAPWQDQQIAEISAQWLRTKRGGELGFTLTKHEDVARQLSEGSADLWVVVDPGGTVHAWCTWRPYLGGQGRVIDVMRRRVDAANPAMDSLLVGVIEHYRDQHLLEVSLASVPRSHGDLGEKLFPARSLRAFKNKFAPTWSPRWLAVPARRHELPALVAVGRAYCPGGLRRAISRNR